MKKEIKINLVFSMAYHFRHIHKQLPKIVLILYAALMAWIMAENYEVVNRIIQAFLGNKIDSLLWLMIIAIVSNQFIVKNNYFVIILCNVTWFALLVYGGVQPLNALIVLTYILALANVCVVGYSLVMYTELQKAYSHMIVEQTIKNLEKSK